MRNVNCQGKIRWEWYNGGSTDLARSSSRNIWINGQEIEVGVHSVSDEDYVEEKRLCQVLHHFKENQRK